MDFFDNVFPFPKKKKTIQYSNERKKFQEALRRNSHDQGLRSQFVKFCLISQNSIEGVPESHVEDGLKVYEELATTDLFDPQLHYLVGRYYHHQGKDNLKAQNVYLAGVQSFNRHVAKHPHLKSDFIDVTYAIALNFVTLQYGQIHPELDKFFSTIRKSYPLHNKRVELENELGKPNPDQALVKQLAKELRELKEATEGLRKKRPAEE